MDELTFYRHVLSKTREERDRFYQLLWVIIYAQEDHKVNISEVTLKTFNNLSEMHFQSYDDPQSRQKIITVWMEKIKEGE